MSGWKQVSRSFFAGTTVITEHNAEEGLYRVSIEQIKAFSDNQQEAKRILANRLTCAAQELVR